MFATIAIVLNATIASIEKTRTKSSKGGSDREQIKRAVT